MNATHKFSLVHRNRYCFPFKTVLVVEDDLLQQSRFAAHFKELFGHQSSVVVTFVPTAVDCYAYLLGLVAIREGVEGSVSAPNPKVIFLDHDLQCGSGVELLAALREMLPNTPVFTASGIPDNNARMMAAGATYNFVKNDIIEGRADAMILACVGDFQRCPAP